MNKFYLAPLQGFTDYAFRQAFTGLFGGPDAAFSPFIETHKPDHRAYRDVLPERNQGCRLVPQVLGNNASEMIPVIDHLISLGYDEINWNLGCPYPMVTRKTMGAGLLPYSSKIEQVLNELFTHKPSLKFSVKMRLGLSDENEWHPLTQILNQYPLTEVIIHARTATQMYKGEINEKAFCEMTGQLLHPVCYNGNIVSLEQYQALATRIPTVSRYMIGRGLLINPLLINEIKTNTKTTLDEVRVAIGKLHDQLFFLNSKRLNGESHVLHKMKPYWEYFNQSFAGYEKGLKKIKKSVTLGAYKIACSELFR